MATYNVDVYMMSVFRYESLYIGLPALYYQTGRGPADWLGFDELPIAPAMLSLYRRSGDWSGFHDVQLACSRDLRHWKRLGNRESFIGSSPLGGGAYDTANIKPPSAPVVRGDELWFYYTGGRFYGVVLDRASHRLASAVCLAVLRRDGFVSLDAGNDAGTVLTRSFDLHGDGCSSIAMHSMGSFASSCSMQPETWWHDRSRCAVICCVHRSHGHSAG